MRAFILTLALLAGCATLATPEATVACQALDGVSTAYALSHGAVEVNPLLAGLSLPGILLVKALVAFALVTYHSSLNPDALAVVNGATCGVGVHNLLLIP